MARLAVNVSRPHAPDDALVGHVLVVEDGEDEHQLHLGLAVPLAVAVLPVHKRLGLNDAAARQGGVLGHRETRKLVVVLGDLTEDAESASSRRRVVAQRPLPHHG